MNDLKKKLIDALSAVPSRSKRKGMVDDIVKNLREAGVVIPEDGHKQVSDFIDVLNELKIYHASLAALKAECDTQPTLESQDPPAKKRKTK